jgi:hypothetical protein
MNDYEKYQKIFDNANKFFREYYKLPFTNFSIYLNENGYEVDFVKIIHNIEGKTSYSQFIINLYDAFKIAQNILVYTFKPGIITLINCRDVFDLNFNYLQTKKIKKIEIKLEFLNI